MLDYQEMNARRIAELGGEISTLARARMARRDPGPRLNIAQLVLALSVGSSHGENSEYLQEYARAAGVNFDSQRPLIPFAAFRDLTATSAPGGGYLVSAETPEAVDILRSWSVTARAGVFIETGLQGDQTVPRVTAKSTPAWLSTETTQLTPSQPTLAQIAMTPKHVGAVINFSRQLARQANAEGFVKRELMRTVGTALDQTVINGTGATGQPTGILNTAGIQTQSGATLNSGVNAMKQKAPRQTPMMRGLPFSRRQRSANYWRTGSASPAAGASCGIARR